MRIVLCVKQVPENDRVSVDPKRGTLRRDGVASILNPFCEYALDIAVKMKEAYGGEIVAVSMGPPQARSALIRCLELGADSAILLSDRAFAGSDVWATSRVLAKVIEAKIPDSDLILCGKQAIDGDTAQVPAELAQALGIPSIYYAETVRMDADDLIVTRSIEGGTVKLRCHGSTVVTVSGGSNIRRVPSMADVLRARGKKIEVLDAASLGILPEATGLQGSLTQVVKVFSPLGRGEGMRVNGSEPTIAAQAMISFLRERGFLEGDGC